MIDDPSWNEDAEIAALLSAERAALDPDPAVQSRVMQRVAVSVGVAVPIVAATVTAKAATTVTATTATALSMKTALLVGVLATAATTTWVVWPEAPTKPAAVSAPDTPKRAVAARSVAPLPAIPPPVLVDAGIPDAAAVLTDSAVAQDEDAGAFQEEDAAVARAHRQEEDAGVARAHPRARTPRRRAAVNPPRPPASDTALAAERRLLETARQAVARRDTPAALAAISKHSARFPSGRLGEEREALRIQALARGGRTEDAKARASAFIRRYPKSLFRRAIETVLRQPDAPSTKKE